jgi:hypothetical protein
MADRNPTDCGESVLTDYVAETRQAERAVLSFLIDEHPSQLTIPEVARTLYAHPGDFEKKDVVERAIRELVGAGLLHCEGAFLVPTRAALYFAGLEIE